MYDERDGRVPVPVAREVLSLNCDPIILEKRLAPIDALSDYERIRLITDSTDHNARFEYGTIDGCVLYIRTIQGHIWKEEGFRGSLWSAGDERL